jgi:hypothetical protein
MKTEQMPRWLAIQAWGDSVRLMPVTPPSTGPDVFCKLQDAEAAVATERERWRAWVEEAVSYVGCETWSPSLKEEGERLLGLKV